MSYALITIVSVAAIAAQDLLGLEALAPEAEFTRISTAAGDTTLIRCSGSVWDRLRPQLRSLSQRRIPALDTAGAVIANHTRPAMSYSMEWVPGGRPRIHQVEGSVSVGGGAALTVRGENLIPGLAAQLNIYRQVPYKGNPAAAGPSVQKWNDIQLIMHVTANAKGPAGNQIALYIGAASGAGSVTTKEYADGLVEISVIPAAGAADTTSIAAQINADSLASVWVTATADVASIQVPAFVSNGAIQGPNVRPGTPYQFLKNGDGCGVAVADMLVSGTDPTNRLRLTAQQGGNQGNLINVTIRMSQGGAAVTTTGNSIVVDFTQATRTLAQIVTAINSDASASALVKATAVGSGSLGSVARTYLAGGGAEQITAQLGGATVAITVHTDTSFTATVSSAALIAAGVAAGEVAQLNVMLDYQRISASLVAAS